MWFKKQLHGEKELNCPRCLTGMRKLKKHDVVIDVCDSCHGMWLDDGEVEKLAKMRNEDGKKKTKKGKQRK